MSPRIDITDAMIAAGLSAYGLWDRGFEEPQGLVVAIMEAALASRARRVAVPRPPHQRESPRLETGP